MPVAVLACGGGALQAQAQEAGRGIHHGGPVTPCPPWAQPSFREEMGAPHRRTLTLLDTSSRNFSLLEASGSSCGRGSEGQANPEQALPVLTSLPAQVCACGW